MGTRLVRIATILSILVGQAAELTPEADEAFSRYAAQVEADLAQSNPFLRVNLDPAQKHDLQQGKILVRPGEALKQGRPPDITGGDVQDWYGAVFVPGVRLDRVAKLMQDYDRYKIYYKPDVIESKLISHVGSDFHVFLRLRRKHVVVVVLNADYDVHYEREGPNQMRVISHSIRIAEVKDPERSYTDEESPRGGHGFLWRLNSYWKFEETPQGVFAECRALSLSRDLPSVLAWFLREFLKKFPSESMFHTLEGTRIAAARNPITSP